ncbi:MAG TPA: hypothetical protein VMZ74_09285 [Ramlibacter sp.]|nr:hypothetical protein [Ramlibacter sp.]
MNRKLALLILPLALAANAQPSSCSSDGAPAPRALLERFINADCENCWKDPQTPDPAPGTLAIDWVAAGSRGDDAPLSAVASRDGGDRLDALGKKIPAQSATHFSQRSGEAPPKMRVAHGLPFNEYIGTSIEMQAAPGGPWKAWLLLVETLPAGSEGTPVERNLVRNAFVADWPTEAKKRYELRPMRIAEGAKFERLRVVGWIEDAKGRVRAIAQSRCER